HGVGLANALAVAADDDALEDLDTRARAFDDVDVHLDGVASAEGGDVVAERRLVEIVKDVHADSLSVTATGRSRVSVIRRLDEASHETRFPCGRTVRKHKGQLCQKRRTSANYPGAA